MAHSASVQRVVVLIVLVHPPLDVAVANNGATFRATGRAFRYTARFGLAAVEPGRREPLG